MHPMTMTLKEVSWTIVKRKCSWIEEWERSWLMQAVALNSHLHPIVWESDCNFIDFTQVSEPSYSFYSFLYLLISVLLDLEPPILDCFSSNHIFRAFLQLLNDCQFLCRVMLAIGTILQERWATGSDCWLWAMRVCPFPNEFGDK